MKKKKKALNTLKFLKKKLKGFTLIEMLVVIAVIGIMSSTVAVSIKGVTERARIAKGLSFNSQAYHLLSIDAVGIWNFDEGVDGTCSDGKDVCDNSGGDNHGNTIGTAWTTDTPGNTGYALSFDGNSNFIDMGWSPDFPLMTDYTVSVWINDNGTGQYDGYGAKVVDKTSYNHEWRLGVQSDGRIEWSTYEGGAGDILNTAGYDYRDSKWHHIAVVKNGIDGYLYVDGDLKEFGSNIKTVDSSGNFLIGYCHSADYLQNKHFGGFIDEVRIYSRALNQAQIQKHYVEGLEKHKNLASSTE
ncbi:LamG-like jellyroll fold domain-containing protein [Patescibacteria group bacterium]